MTDTTHHRAERLSPGDAFALLGSETRVDILRALVEAARDGDFEDPVPFTTLRAAVGMADSGQFNYHLGKLVGHFVERVDGEDEVGYRLRQAGFMIAGAIIAGAYTGTASGDPVAVDGVCFDCDDALEVRYVDERMVVGCTNCEATLLGAAIPPGALAGYDRAEFPAVFDRWMGTLVDRARAGFCISCTSRVEAELVHREGESVVEYACSRCPECVVAEPGVLLRDHPAVVSFYHDHGADPREIPSWELPWLYAEPAVVTEDPLSVAVTVRVDDEELTLTLDESAAVVAVDGPTPATG